MNRRQEVIRKEVATHTWADQEQSGVTLFVGLSESAKRNTLCLVVSDLLVHDAGLLGSGEAGEWEKGE